MSKLKDLVWVRPNPTNPAKPFYHTIGCIATTKKGGQCVLINLMPMGPDWKGVLQAYDPKVKEPAPLVAPTAGDTPNLEEDANAGPF